MKKIGSVSFVIAFIICAVLLYFSKLDLQEIEKKYHETYENNIVLSKEIKEMINMSKEDEELSSQLKAEMELLQNRITEFDNSLVDKVELPIFDTESVSTYTSNEFSEYYTLINTEEVYMLPEKRFKLEVLGDNSVVRVLETLRSDDRERWCLIRIYQNNGFYPDHQLVIGYCKAENLSKVKDNEGIDDIKLITGANIDGIRIGDTIDKVIGIYGTNYIHHLEKDGHSLVFYDTQTEIRIGKEVPITDQEGEIEVNVSFNPVTRKIYSISSSKQDTRVNDVEVVGEAFVEVNKKLEEKFRKISTEELIRIGKNPMYGDDFSNFTGEENIYLIEGQFFLEIYLNEELSIVEGVRIFRFWLDFEL